MSLIDHVGPLQKRDPIPLYQQLHTALRQAIEQRVLSPDEAMPTERDLAAALDVSRITVRKAIDRLAREGIVTRRRGAGTFVTHQRIEKPVAKLTSFSQDMISRGRRPHSVWVSKAFGMVTSEEAFSLGVALGTHVYRFQRVRYADGTSMALEYSVIPTYCLPSVDAVGTSLYEALEASGHAPVRVLQRLRAIAFTSEQADLLSIEPNAPGLFIERRGYHADGRTVEFTQSYYRGDTYDMVAELTA